MAAEPGRGVSDAEFELPSGSVESETITGGKTTQLNLTVPAQPGSYDFYCPVGTHRAKGMVGTLIVAAP